MQPCRGDWLWLPWNEDAAVASLGLPSSALAPTAQAFMGNLAGQVRKELVAWHAAVERQQIEESVNVDVDLHIFRSLALSFQHQVFCLSAPSILLVCPKAALAITRVQSFCSG